MEDTTLGKVAGAVGKGLLAGLVGTAAITASQSFEMKLTGRDQSATPAKAVEEVLDVEPEDSAAEERLSNLTHVAYGTAWGAFRGILGAMGIRGPLATVLHWIAVSAAAAVMLPQLKLAPPPTKQPPNEIAIQSLHHAVYTAVAGLVYDAIERE